MINEVPADAVLQLTPLEARILGSLIEKELTTPEYYPLTLNALLAACAQKNNRDPVMTLDEETLGRGVYSLQDKGLVESFAGAAARSIKYRERLLARLELTPPERAVVCELLLRGAQTPGELRTRASRMHPFASPEEVQAALASLAARATGPLVVELPRQPGQKETRYAHLLGDQPPTVAPVATGLPPPAVVVAAQGEAARLRELEARVAALEAELAELRTTLHTFKSQFEA
jgi:uncharacterized protein YceH (UPF0502 family)